MPKDYYYYLQYKKTENGIFERALESQVPKRLLHLSEQTNLSLQRYRSTRVETASLSTSQMRSSGVISSTVNFKMHGYIALTLNYFSRSLVENVKIKDDEDLVKYQFVYSAYCPECFFPAVSVSCQEYSDFVYTDLKGNEPPVKTVLLMDSLICEQGHKNEPNDYLIGRKLCHVSHAYLLPFDNELKIQKELNEYYKL